MEDRSKKLFAVSALVFLLAAASPTPAQAAPARASCAELAGVRIPAERIGLPTTGAEVTDARMVDASGEGSAAIGAYCRVEASIHPVDPSAPDIRMRLALPTRWNGRAMMFGGGAFDGVVPDVTANVPYGPADRLTPLGRGYATFASDAGHQSPPSDLPSPTMDGSFAVNDEALHNFAGDALKKTRDTAVHLINRHYGTAPSSSYFAGGSGGGREALAVAQRWPTDFNGVISAFPAWNPVPLVLHSGYEAQLLSKPDAFPGPAQQELLYRSVIKACDGNDGVRDGIISDEARCDFDPRTLRCPQGEKSATTCLTDSQIAATEAISTPMRWNYRLASGETGYPGLPFLSGARMATPVVGLGTQAPAHPMPMASGAGILLWDQWARYFLTRDPALNTLSLDPLRPGRWQQRISDLSAFQDVNNPDLRAFAKAGGKLLILHGTADEIVSHRSTAEYYRRVMHTMGRTATERFARLYLIPGANHGNIQPAFAASWDALTALENWTGYGRPPVHPVVTDMNPTAQGRTRPLCEYPAWPRYNGSGDPDSATNFVCHRGAEQPGSS
ncbi:hypothetical protein ABIE67_009525 [Streptomyces sp. V4I8]|uniref:tannase/feruloyl esterase family alpha/beta hydrolase n=1 Tax=Streptomyces sp. V4I8 TaxID=3156469 RepID=UPI003517D722